MRVFLTVLLLVVATPGCAITIAEYLEAKERKNPAEAARHQMYIQGFGSGFSSANAILETKRQARLYCQPENFDAKAINYQRILDDEIARLIAKASAAQKPRIMALDIDVPLFGGLEEMFPCR